MFTSRAKREVPLSRHKEQLREGRTSIFEKQHGRVRVRGAVIEMSWFHCEGEGSAEPPEIGWAQLRHGAAGCVQSEWGFLPLPSCICKSPVLLCVYAVRSLFLLSSIPSCASVSHKLCFIIVQLRNICVCFVFSFSLMGHYFLNKLFIMKKLVDLFNMVPGMWVCDLPVPNYITLVQVTIFNMLRKLLIVLVWLLSQNWIAW